MKLIRKVLICLGIATASTAYSQESIYDLSVKNIDGEEVSLSTFKGKVALIVNTASKCGFTGQYEGLEKLYRDYKERGLVVLGFPSNDFLGQEPGNSEEIKSFCRLKYDVTFPLFEKGKVTGDDKQRVYKILTENSGDFEGEVRWNFEKFLINREGKIIGRFRTFTSPLSDRVISAIENELSSKE